MDPIPEGMELPTLDEFESTSPSQLEDLAHDLDNLDVTNNSPYSEGSVPVGSSSICGRTTKEYEEMLRQLKKDNFNLKLRIYYLEDLMSKARGGCAPGDRELEKRILDLKVELKKTEYEVQRKQRLLEDADRVISKAEERHEEEVRRLRQEMQDIQARSRIRFSIAPSSTPAAYPTAHQGPLDNSMQLYLDAFNVRPSLLMPPPPPPPPLQADNGVGQMEAGSPQPQPQQQQNTEQRVAELTEQLQLCMAELEASKEREQNLSEVLDSKEPDIQIKVQELSAKDALLEEQRKIIVEIEIKLDEKQKQLEALRQTLSATQTTVARQQAEAAALQQRLQEGDRKYGKSAKVVQNLLVKNKKLASDLLEAREKHNKAQWEATTAKHTSDELGEMTTDETERLWAELDLRRQQCDRLTKEYADLQREKAATEKALQQELADVRLQLDRASRAADTSLVPHGVVSDTAELMLRRLDELASFLTALLKRPQLLAELPAGRRSSLLRAVEHTWGSARQRYSMSLSLSWQQERSGESLGSCSLLAEDASLIAQIKDFLAGTDQEELMSEAEAERERTQQLWPVSMSEALADGREVELVTYEGLRVRPEDEEEEAEEGGGTTAVEREPPGNHSESEAWSEPDRSVSLARIGLPDSRTPVAPTSVLTSPASSEADLITRTPGKRSSTARRLTNKLRDVEQVNDALKAELSAYQALFKSLDSPKEPAIEVALEQIGIQRHRLNEMLKQNDIIRRQLENTRTSTYSRLGDECHARETQVQLEDSRVRVQQLEVELTAALEQCRSLEAQLAERDSLHATAQAQFESTLAALRTQEMLLQEEARDAHALVTEAEQRCSLVEEAAALASQQHEQLEKRLAEAHAQCELLREQVEVHETVLKPSYADHSVQTAEPNLELLSTGPSSLVHLSDLEEVFHGVPVPDSPHEEGRRQTLSSPDLGIESDTGRTSSLEAPPSPGEEVDELTQLRERAAKRDRLLQACLATLNKRTRTRQEVVASIKEQLRRTDQVLTQAKSSLHHLLPSEGPHPAPRTRRALQIPPLTP